MTTPVQPPELPPIVQTLAPETRSSVYVSSSDSQSVDTLSSATSPQAIAPESSQSGVSTSAELLGPPIAIGYPIQVETKASNAVSQSIPPLRVSDAITPSFITKLKTLTAETSIEPVAQTQPATPIPREEQQPLVQPVPAPSIQLPGTTQPETQPSEQSPLVQPAPPPIQLPVTPQPSESISPQEPPRQSPTSSPVTERIVELTSDRQEYDEQRQIVTAIGNVVLRFNQAVLNADRLQINLPNLIAVGDGNVALTRGDQLVRGQRFTYNFIQDSGELLSARGDIYLPTADTDFSPTLPTDVTAGRSLLQPLDQVSSPGGLGFSVGSTRSISNVPLPQTGGALRRVRFEAERVDINPEGWQARNVRLTNDPFSPPELEVRADTVVLTRETPNRSRIKTTRQRLVFDQRLSVPIPRDEAVIDRNPRDVSPAIVQVGYDSGDRGGLFIERGFTPINNRTISLRVTPQFFVQKAVQESGGNIFDPELYGLRARLTGDLGPRTTLQGKATFTSLNLNDIDRELRASLRLRQIIGNRLPHTLTLESSYRDRLYNGTLGYQTVQSSLGGILTSPVIPLGRTGINLSYQVGAQYIDANVSGDRLDLLEPVRDDDRASLGRFQGTAALSRGFLLWQGRPLPSTAREGLRYTSVPVVPYLVAIAGLSGTTGFYTSGDNQSILTGTVGLVGQFGHFSRPFLDYTGFNIIYSQSLRSGLSPFLFDRAADTKVLTAGFSQQIYGPFRIGVQTILNVDTREQISTDYILEYNRRTYGVTLRYNPVLELGSLSLRISEFNWAGGSNPFSDSEVRPVVGGVRQEND